ncbi:MAG: hypothetical protein H6Q05_4939, partial [Acidobacteria bacterium]|nr:hypothetical protein [Acidobacteriota bacterium]
KPVLASRIIRILQETEPNSLKPLIEAVTLLESAAMLVHIR